MNAEQLRMALQNRAGIACRLAFLRGDDVEQNPYLPGSDQWHGWETEKQQLTAFGATSE